MISASNVLRDSPVGSNKSHKSLLCLQLGGFVEKYAGSGVSVHTQSRTNKENRRTEGLNRYLQTLQSTQINAPGQREDCVMCTADMLRCGCNMKSK